MSLKVGTHLGTVNGSLGVRVGLNPFTCLFNRHLSSVSVAGSAGAGHRVVSVRVCTHVCTLTHPPSALELSRGPLWATLIIYHLPGSLMAFEFTIPV